jgi:uncharacterized RDD family membrane protein YckC
MNFKESEGQNKNKKYAGFWKRFASLGLEYLGMFTISIFLFDLFHIENYFQQWWIVFLPFLIILIINLILYFTKSQTLGYLILGLHIENKDDDEKVKVSKLVNRFFSKYIMLIAGCFIISSYLRVSSGEEIILNYIIAGLLSAGIIFLSIIFHKQKQALYDKQLDLVVVDKKNERFLTIFLIIVFFISALIFSNAEMIKTKLEIQNMKNEMSRDLPALLNDIKEESLTLSEIKNKTQQRPKKIYIELYKKTLTERQRERLKKVVMQMETDGISGEQIEGFLGRKVLELERTYLSKQKVKEIIKNHPEYNNSKEFGIKVIDDLVKKGYTLEGYGDAENKKDNFFGLLNISGKTFMAIKTALIFYLIVIFIILKEHLEFSFKQMFKNI